MANLWHIFLLSENKCNSGSQFPSVYQDCPLWTPGSPDPPSGSAPPGPASPGRSVHLLPVSLPLSRSHRGSRGCALHPFPREPAPGSGLICGPMSCSPRTSVGTLRAGSYRLLRSSRIWKCPRLQKELFVDSVPVRRRAGRSTPVPREKVTAVRDTAQGNRRGLAENGSISGEPQAAVHQHSGWEARTEARSLVICPPHLPPPQCPPGNCPRDNTRGHRQDCSSGLHVHTRGTATCW